MAAALLGAWVYRERRSSAPLVDLALLRNPAVAGANVVMLLGGVGMYLLLTLVTRYVQTPRSAGYGLGVDVFVAGLVLVPFSALGFAGGKLVSPLRKRHAPATVCDVSHRYRIHDSGVGRRGGDGGHRRHRALSPAGISSVTRGAFKSFGVNREGNPLLASPLDVFGADL
ncbi:hypothetical protein [Streptomyces sp. NPDC097640]|uniref:hypothetical protein n=1 Tax=Streptomyces sp. NPDC097640 TaxID=3157229 RepID=UPI00332DA6E1